jgi:signal transduction histidine kinase
MVREQADIVCDYGVVPPVRAHETRLVQVLLNLLLNAAQSFPAERRGTVNVKIETLASGSASVEVADNGCGIDNAHIPHLFEPFFTTKPPGVGTGLGLFVCRKLVEDLGGQISLESQLSKGTTVRVVLPPDLRAS